MSRTLVGRLAVLPQRQFHLLAWAALLIAAALMWTGVVGPAVRQLRVSSKERAALALLPHDVGLVQQQGTALQARIAELQSSLGLTPARAGVDRRQLELVSAIDASARAHGLLMLSATPAPLRTVAAFSGIPIDVTATGSYQQVGHWLTALEQTLPNAAITTVELDYRADATALDVKLTVVAYFPQDTP